MNSQVVKSNVLRVAIASRPKFFSAAVSPVLVGSCLGFAVSSSFDVPVFAAALIAMILIHAGANLSNDYFDHVSKNDWINENVTPFSGGGRSIQNDLLSPKAVLLAALVMLTFGAVLGIGIVLATQNWFVLAVGVVGCLGAFFYTAGPVKLGYRTVGEVIIFFLFGVLPVYAAYTLQARPFLLSPLLPACIVGILIFLVILINEFPDMAADRAVQKKTIVVRFGAPAAVWVYRVVLALSYLIALAMLLLRQMRYAGALYMLTLPLGVQAWVQTNPELLVRPQQFQGCRTTVMLHAAGSLALAIGFIVAGVRG